MFDDPILNDAWGILQDLRADKHKFKTANQALNNARLLSQEAGVISDLLQGLIGTFNKLRINLPADDFNRLEIFRTAWYVRDFFTDCFILKDHDLPE